MAIFNRCRFQSYYRYKNIINVNKNAKLEEFYNVRNRFIFYRKLTNNARMFRRFRNMKWMIAKFKMVPRISFYPSLFRKHNYIFKKKQQLKIFYGKFTEKKFKKIVLTSKNSSKTLESSSYFNIIETRLDVLLLRAKILPTIFSCNQLLVHKKVLINNNIITNKNTYPIKQGDFVSLKKDYWGNIYRYLLIKSNIRFIGHSVLKKVVKRQRRKSATRNKIRKFFFKNFKYLQFFFKYKKRFLVHLSAIIAILKSGNKLLVDVYAIKIAHFILMTLFDKFILYYRAAKGLRRWSINRYAQNDMTACLLKHQIKSNLMLLNISLKNHFLEFMLQIRESVRFALSDNEEYILHESYWLYTESVQEEYYFDFVKDLEEFLLIRLYRHFKFYSKLAKLPETKTYPINNRSHLEVYPWFNPVPQWYVPKYLEVDYTTLRVGVIQKPQKIDIVYPFNIDLSSVYNFYSLKGY